MLDILREFLLLSHSDVTERAKLYSTVRDGFIGFENENKGFFQISFGFSVSQRFSLSVDSGNPLCIAEGSTKASRKNRVRTI